MDDYLTINTYNCYFTTELRMYGNNGYAIFKSTNVIQSISARLGKSGDSLDVFGSVDGVDYALVENVEVATAFNYFDFSFEGMSYKYLKFDLSRTKQVRMKEFTMVYKKQKKIHCKVNFFYKKNDNHLSLIHLFIELIVNLLKEII